MNWTLVSGDYIASGGENYLIIGSFKYDSAINLIYWNHSSGFSAIGVIIDDVSLTSCATGIEEQAENDKIKVYPNPITTKLNCTVEFKEIFEITLSDISSRELLQQKFTNSVTLNTEQLAKGIYIYEVRNKNGVIKKGKVVKE